MMTILTNMNIAETIEKCLNNENAREIIKKAEDLSVDKEQNRSVNLVVKTAKSGDFEQAAQILFNATDDLVLRYDSAFKERVRDELGIESFEELMTLYNDLIKKKYREMASS